MNLSLQFLGAAGTVTGSRHLLQAGDKKILVDCGLFQGLKELRLKNWAPFPVPPSSIDAVILTHAHLDHSGYLPVLVRSGFQGVIYGSSPTEDLTRILLADAARIEEEDAEYANRKGYSKHSPALPLFTVEEARAACRQIRAVETEAWHEIFPRIRLRLRNSGHILGSTFVEVDVDGRLVVFTGDLGRTEPLVLRPRTELKQADYLVLESTYGDRLHGTEPPLEALRAVILETVEKKGHLLIPSFAVGRTQDILCLLARLKRESRIPAIPIYLDSPLASEATEILSRHREWQRLEPEESRALASVATIVETRDQSKALLAAKHSTIVIAGSGMIAGGRILHHLEYRVGDPNNTVLLVGYQAPGTRGAQLERGAAEIKMHGRFFPVRAAVRTLTGLSAHADQGETINWLRAFTAPPRRTFLVHGEPQSLDALRVKVEHELHWQVSIPAMGDTEELVGTEAVNEQGRR